MHIHVASVFRSLFCKWKLLLLALCCCLGFSCGMIAAHRSDDTYFSMMRMAFTSHVSIPGLIASVSLPFLFSAFAVYLGKPKLIYFICFIKAALFSFGSFTALTAFASAGWLVRFLLQFSDIVMLPAFCWFSLRCITDTGLFKRDFSICLFLFLLIGSMDYCMVSPFLAMLIDI